MDGSASRTEISRRTLLKAAGAAAGIAGAGVIAAACGLATAPAPSSSAASPRRGGTLVYVRSTDAITLDPPYAGDAGGSGNTILMLYQGLVAYSADLEIRPSLATKWEATGTTWVLTLRPGVRFHDGTPFNAAAVKAHIDRLIGPEKPLRANQWVPYVENVDAVDDFTVRITTKFVDGNFLPRLADTSGFIVSPTAFAKAGRDGIARNPVGTGPFKFVEWVKDDRLTLERFDDYWGDKAYLDKVIIRPVPDAEARAIALESGDAQIAGALNPEQIDRVQSNQRLTILTKPTTRNQFVGMAALKKPWSDVRVRQALNWAVDKESIVKNLFAGTAEVLNGAVAPGIADYVPAQGFGYDPAKAKALLAEAGYGGGFSASLVGTKGQIAKDYELQQLLQQQFKAVGVDVKLETLENAKYLDLLRMDPTKSPLEMWMDNWGGVNAADVIENRYGCDSFRPKGNNTAGFCDKRVSELTTEAMRTTDATKRLALMKEAQERVSVAAPSVWLFVSKAIVGAAKKLHDPFLSRNGSLYADEHTWLES